METVQEEVTTPKPGFWKRRAAWFGRKSITGKAVWILILIALLLMIFSERPLFSIAFVAIRIYWAVALVLSLIFWGIYKLIARKSKIAGGTTVVILIAAIIAGMIFLDFAPWKAYSYLSSYYRYQTLNKVMIDDIPETAHEVIQSQVAIHTNAQQKVLSGNSKITEPSIQRIGSDTSFSWTMAKEPNYFNARLNDNIRTVYNVPAGQSSPKNIYAEVNFAIGETLFLGREIHAAVMRALPVSYLFNTTIGEPRFMTDDHGKWVQVVPLIRWRSHGFWGIFFPQPEFGGVHVITQQDGHVSHMFVTKAFWKRAFFGAGTTYSPKELKQFGYLQNQNLMSHEILESIAKSFRFQDGFYAPMRVSHQGDTRIPTMDEGIGGAPITAYFKMSGVNKNAASKLYDYYPLEPYDTTNHSVVVSVYIPSDGRGPIYVHRYTEEDVYSGISTILGYAKDSRDQTDWEQSKIADGRPYNRKINGRTQPFWLFSKVTRAQSSHGYISASNSSVGLFDPIKNKVIWVDPDNPESWISKLSPNK